VLAFCSTSLDDSEKHFLLLSSIFHRRDDIYRASAAANIMLSSPLTHFAPSTPTQQAAAYGVSRSTFLPVHQPRRRYTTSEIRTLADACRLLKTEDGQWAWALCLKRGLSLDECEGVAKEVEDHVSSTMVNIGHIASPAIA